MTQESELVRQARILFQQSSSWADFSNAIYDPLEGLLARAFQTRDERRQFLATPEFAEIQKLLNQAVKQFGLVEGASPKRLTEFMEPQHLAPTTDDSPSIGIVTAEKPIATHMLVAMRILRIVSYLGLFVAAMISMDFVLGQIRKTMSPDGVRFLGDILALASMALPVAFVVTPVLPPFRHHLGWRVLFGTLISWELSSHAVSFGVTANRAIAAQEGRNYDGGGITGLTLVMGWVPPLFIAGISAAIVQLVQRFGPTSRIFPKS